jgi:hypothetical protein
MYPPNAVFRKERLQSGLLAQRIHRLSDRLGWNIKLVGNFLSLDEGGCDGEADGGDRAVEAVHDDGSPKINSYLWEDWTTAKTPPLSQKKDFDGHTTAENCRR